MSFVEKVWMWVKSFFKTSKAEWKDDSRTVVPKYINTDYSNTSYTLGVDEVSKTQKERKVY